MPTFQTQLFYLNMIKDQDTKEILFFQFARNFGVKLFPRQAHSNLCRMPMMVAFAQFSHALCYHSIFLCFSLLLSFSFIISSFTFLLKSV